MTALLRCRGSTAEMARLFDAVPDADLDWRETSWSGDPVPVVFGDGDARRLTTSRWGLPEDAYAKAVAVKQRGTLYSRDLVSGPSRLSDPARLRRCLILVESFAYPDGPVREATRAWFGLRDTPLSAWAGFSTPDGSCCAGLLMLANERVAPCSHTMPWLLTPAGQERWLEGAGQLSIGVGYEADAFYRENLGECWSTGRLGDDDATAPFDPA
jgi:putative SOS response-associated peptidase YedK